MRTGLAIAGFWAIFCGGAVAGDDGYFPANAYQARFCAGLTQEMRQENASRVDCTSSTHAMIIEFQDYWREAIGQAIAFAAETGLRPGIVLVCRNDEQHCMNAAARIEIAFGHFAVPLTLWSCSIMSSSLAACPKVECGAEGCT
jgi:hypothetical protein